MKQCPRPLLIPSYQVVHHLVCGKRRACRRRGRLSQICCDELRSTDQSHQGDQGANCPRDTHWGSPQFKLSLSDSHRLEDCLSKKRHWDALVLSDLDNSGGRQIETMWLLT